VEEQQRAYYAVIPATVRYDKALPANAKLLYGEITALCNESGACWASNQYFAELYGTTTRNIARWVSALCEQGHISSEIRYKEESKEVEKRILRLLAPHDKNVMTPMTEMSPPHDKNVMENNKYINNYINNNSLNNSSISPIEEKKKETKKKEKNRCTIPPSLEEVSAYCTERNNGISPQAFIDFYAARDWRVGKVKMVDWKAAVRTWEHRRKETESANVRRDSKPSTGKYSGLEVVEL
jgi:hypothetical protein